MTESTLARTRPTGSRLVAADGRTLPLRAAQLRSVAGAGLARTRLIQRFANPHREPLAVTYQLPLPADGAVAAFAFTIGDRRVVGEIDRREAARERYEQALVEGHSAALVEQDRDSLFCQEIGNIPPGAEVVAELTIDQPLQWLTDGSWEWRFPTVVAPRYLGAPGRVPDADRIAVDVVDGATPPRLELELRLRDAIEPGRAPSSPSHPLVAARDDTGTNLAFTSEGGANLDRDVVVRWSVAAPRIGVDLIAARPGPEHDRAAEAFGLLTIVPPVGASLPEQVARDVIVLLDISGSMHGEPLDQAKAVTAALIGELTPRDQLEMIAFASRPKSWSRRPVSMDSRSQTSALRWLRGLDAGGGTEMGQAVIAALQPLDLQSLRQVVLVTDGQIGFEEEIVREVLHRLPGASRLHTVGVGSCPNRSLTRSAARAGRGTETLVGLGEDPGPAAARLSAATAAPQLVEVELDGPALVETAPERIPDVLAGMPARVAVRLDPRGGRLKIRGRCANGAWASELDVPGTTPGSGRPELVSLFGREQVSDLETRIAAGEADGVEERIEALGLSFAIATRRTSWVAVSADPTVDPRAPLRRERVPQELPYGMSVERLGLRTAAICAAPTETMLTLHQTPLAASAPPRSSGKARGILRKMAAPFFEEEPDAESEDLAFPEPILVARIALRRDGYLVIELTSDGDVWSLPCLVELVSDDGRTFVAEVDVEHTTRPGGLPAGSTIRLRVHEPDEARDVPLRAIRLDGEEVELQVS